VALASCFVGLVLGYVAAGRKIYDVLSGAANGSEKA
jgi:hypothetical protein